MRRVVFALLAAAAIAGCGGNTANEDQSGQATGSFPVNVSTAFPAKQHLAQENDHLVIKVTNTGERTMPNVAVTLTNPKYGTSAGALSTLLAEPAPGQPILAGRSRPVWIVNQGPSAHPIKCPQVNAGGSPDDGQSFNNNYSACVGGTGGGTTAYTNTWALGPLPAHQTRTFDWDVTPFQPGHYTIDYQVAAGLSGSAPATGNSKGQIVTQITPKPRQAYINNAGQPVYSP
ncbi:MAG: hypothetical protein J2O48_09470 [Solirubrobacterales bacterium]|nr:hypothetical protein [Solirubrobacterales bacterium]